MGDTKALFTIIVVFMNLIFKKAEPMQVPQQPPPYPDRKHQGLIIYELHACQKQHKQLQAAAILLKG